LAVECYGSVRIFRIMIRDGVADVALLGTLSGGKCRGSGIHYALSGRVVYQCGVNKKAVITGSLWIVGQTVFVGFSTLEFVQAVIAVRIPGGEHVTFVAEFSSVVCLLADCLGTLPEIELGFKVLPQISAIPVDDNAGRFGIINLTGAAFVRLANSVLRTGSRGDIADSNVLGLEPFLFLAKLDGGVVEAVRGIHHRGRLALSIGSGHNRSVGRAHICNVRRLATLL